MRTGLKVEERFKGDDIVDTVTLTRRFVDFSYVDGNEYVFMDKEDYTPYTFTKEQIEEELQFIPEGGMPDMQVLTRDGQLLALELPQTVDTEIVETAPGIKGASASSRTKPATMSTGLVIQGSGIPDQRREKSAFISKSAAIWAARTNLPPLTVARPSVAQAGLFPDSGAARLIRATQPATFGSSVARLSVAQAGEYPGWRRCAPYPGYTTRDVR